MVDVFRSAEAIDREWEVACHEDRSDAIGQRGIGESLLEHFGLEATDRRVDRRDHAEEDGLAPRSYLIAVKQVRVARPPPDEREWCHVLANLGGRAREGMLFTVERD